MTEVNAGASYRVAGASYRVAGSSYRVAASTRRAGDRYAATWTTDALSGKGVPVSAAEWAAVVSVAGGGAPSALHLLQEAAGNAADSIGAFPLTAGGTLSYQQAVAGWTRLAIRTTSGTSGSLRNVAAGLPDINVSSFALLMYILTPAVVVVPRTIAQLGAAFGTETSMEGNASEQAVLNAAGSTTAGAATFYNGAVHPVYLQVDRTANVSAVYTDQEAIVGLGAAGNGKMMMLGGDNIVSRQPDAISYLYNAAFFLAAAERSAAQIKTLFQTLGFTVAW